MTPALEQAVGRLRAGELSLAEAFRQVAERRAADPDVFHLCRQLGAEARARAERLAPFAEPAAGEGPPPAGESLLADLRALFLLAQRSFVDGTIVLRAAQAAREAELLEAATAGLGGTQTALKWLRTRISTAAPQELTVP
ncbi:MAG TPA: hypothetical protein VD704_06695 [Gaiellaceae bacterium]|nr:hypothetical protein [Gaiellaceae bacterium]